MHVSKLYWEAVREHRLLSVLVVGLIGFSGLCEGAALLALRPILGSLRAEHQVHSLQSLSLFVLLGVGAAVAGVLSQSLLLHVRTDIERRSRETLSAALLTMSWPAFTQMRVGDISKSIVSEGQQINEGINCFLDALGSMITVACLLSLSLYTSPQLTLCTIVFGLGGGLVFRWVAQRARLFSRRLSRLQSEIGERVGEIFVHARFYRATGKESRAQQELQGLFAEYRRCFYWAFQTAMLLRGVFEAAAVVFVALFLLISQTYFQESVAATLVFLALFYRLVPRLLRVQDGIFRAKNYASWYESWRDRLQVVQSQQRSEVSGSQSVPDWTVISFQQVSFQYPGTSRPAIDGITLSIERGTCVAIVGPSGSGKTTLLELLLCLLSPSQGKILCGERDLKEIDRVLWHESIGLVTQRAPIFSGTILENIAWGEERPDRAQAVRAAQKAMVWEDIQKLEGRLDAIVGENGNTLSGGQQQRIAIARALYRCPPVLILDEMTSALDKENEAQIHHMLEALKGEHTIIIVSHREPSLAIADRVITMHEGRVRDALGTPELRLRECVHGH